MHGVHTTVINSYVNITVVTTYKLFIVIRLIDKKSLVLTICYQSRYSPLGTTILFYFDGVSKVFMFLGVFTFKRLI